MNLTGHLSVCFRAWVGVHIHTYTQKRFKKGMKISLVTTCKLCWRLKQKASYKTCNTIRYLFIVIILKIAVNQLSIRPHPCPSSRDQLILTAFASFFPKISYKSAPNFHVTVKKKRRKSLPSNKPCHFFFLFYLFIYNCIFLWKGSLWVQGWRWV